MQRFWWNYGNFLLTVFFYFFLMFLHIWLRRRNLRACLSHKRPVLRFIVRTLKASSVNVKRSCSMRNYCQSGIKIINAKMTRLKDKAYCSFSVAAAAISSTASPCKTVVAVLHSLLTFCSSHNNLIRRQQPYCARAESQLHNKRCGWSLRVLQCAACVTGAWLRGWSPSSSFAACCCWLRLVGL